MIEDLDGANVEPTRRGHVFALSAATAAVALALLAALVVPPSRGNVAVSPSPAPSALNVPTLTLISEGERFRLGSGRVTLDQLAAQPWSQLMCTTPRPDLWGPFVLGGVSYSVSDGTRRALPPPAAVAVPTTVSVFDGTGRQLLYTCVEPLAPRIDLLNIAP